MSIDEGKQLAICDMLPADLTQADKYRRVTTAESLFRQSIYTLECQGMPAEAVLAILAYVAESEAIIRGRQAAR